MYHYYHYYYCPIHKTLMKNCKNEKKRGRKYIYCHHVFPVFFECAFELTPSKENFAKIKKVVVIYAPSMSVIHLLHP